MGNSYQFSFSSCKILNHSNEHGKDDWPGHCYLGLLAYTYSCIHFSGKLLPFKKLVLIFLAKHQSCNVIHEMKTSSNFLIESNLIMKSTLLELIKNRIG